MPAKAPVAPDSGVVDPQAVYLYLYGADVMATPNYQREATTANDALRRVITAGDPKAIRRAETQVRKTNEAWLEAHGSDIERAGHQNPQTAKKAERLRKQSSKRLVEELHTQMDKLPDHVDHSQVADTYLARDQLTDAYYQGTEANKKTAGDSYDTEFERFGKAAFTKSDPDKLKDILEREAKRSRNEARVFAEGVASAEFHSKKDRAQRMQSAYGNRYSAAFKVVSGGGNGSGCIMTGDPTLDGGGAKAKAGAQQAHTSKLDLDDLPMYRGHKGPGVGYLKADLPSLRDGDSDRVVAERRAKKNMEYKKAPVRRAGSKPAKGGRGHRSMK